MPPLLKSCSAIPKRVRIPRKAFCGTSRSSGGAPVLFLAPRRAHSPRRPHSNQTSCGGAKCFVGRRSNHQSRRKRGLALFCQTLRIASPPVQGHRKKKKRARPCSTLTSLRSHDGGHASGRRFYFRHQPKFRQRFATALSNCQSCAGSHHRFQLHGHGS